MCVIANVKRKNKTATETEDRKVNTNIPQMCVKMCVCLSVCALDFRISVGREVIPGCV